MCDVRVFFTFIFVVKILQRTRGCWWKWFKIDVPPSPLNLVLRWLLFYLFCTKIVINAVIATARTFEPWWKREVWRHKIWFSPPYLWKCLYQVRVITGFPVFRLLTDFVCLYTYEFWLSLWKIGSEFGNFVITLIVKSGRWKANLFSELIHQLPLSLLE